MSMSQRDQGVIRSLVEMYVANRATYLVISIMALLFNLATLMVLLLRTWPLEMCISGG